MTNDQGPKAFAAGEVVFRPGDPGDRAYLVEEGRFEILDGETRLTVAGPGDVFGEMGLIEERPRKYTARAVTAGRAAALTREQFERDLLHDPAKARHYLGRLFERLRELSDRLVHGGDAPVEPAAGPKLRVTLHPLTRRAAEVLPEGGLELWKFPFRIGRATEADEREALDLNDLWLLDTKPFQVSRNHMLIDAVGEKKVVLRDRGSYLGTVVNELIIGGPSPTREVELHAGDNVVVVGTIGSPYQFRAYVEWK